MQPDSSPPRRTDYYDFDLEIGPGRGREYPVVVLDSPAGTARATMHFPYAGSQSTIVLARQDVWRANCKLCAENQYDNPSFVALD